MVLKTLCPNPQIKLSDLDRVNINFLDISVACVICSLNVSLLSIIISRYFMVFTWRNLLFRYTSKSSLFSFSSCHQNCLGFSSLKLTSFSLPKFRFFQLYIGYVFKLPTVFPLLVVRESMRKLIFFIALEL